MRFDDDSSFVLFLERFRQILLDDSRDVVNATSALRRRDRVDERHLRMKKPRFRSAVLFVSIYTYIKAVLRALNKLFKPSIIINNIIFNDSSGCFSLVLQTVERRTFFVKIRPLWLI